MFQELIELFKRLVAAHEKQAEAAMLMAQHHAYPLQSVGFIDYAAPNGTECTAGATTEGEGEAAGVGVGTEAAEPTPPVTATEVLRANNSRLAAATQPEWDPYKAAPMKAYKGNKQQIMRDELKNVFGLEPGDKLSGSGLHALLIEKAKERGYTCWSDAHSAPKVDEDGYPLPTQTTPTAPQAPAPTAPQAPVMQPPLVPTAPAAQVTYEMVKDALYALFDKNQPEAFRLMQEIGGVTRLTDAASGAPTVPQEKWPTLYNAALQAQGRV